MTHSLKDIVGVRDILFKISFLGGISGTELDLMLGYFEEITFKTGDVISKNGDHSSHIFIIRSGRVELRIVDENHDIRKREFTVGDHFGEVSMLSMINDTATFLALDDCECIAFPRKSLMRLKNENADLFSRLLLNLARDLARKLQYSADLMLRG